MSGRNDSRPFAIQLEVEFLDRLSEPVRDGRAKSVSELIRTALEHYNFDNVVVVRPSQLLISVRLPTAIRQNLKRISRAKHTSVGQLVRAAVEAYLPQVESGMTKLDMPIPHVELPEAEPESTPNEPVSVAKAPARPRTKRKNKKSASRTRPRPSKGPTKATPARARKTSAPKRTPRPARATRAKR